MQTVKTAEFSGNPVHFELSMTGVTWDGDPWNFVYAHLNKLEKLSFRNGSLNSISHGFHAMKKLKYFDVRYNDIQYITPGICELNDLTEFLVTGNPVETNLSWGRDHHDGSFPTTERIFPFLLKFLPALEHLQLAGNSALNNEGFETLKGLKRLGKLQRVRSYSFITNND